MNFSKFCVHSNRGSLLKKRSKILVPKHFVMINVLITGQDMNRCLLLHENVWVCVCVCHLCVYVSVCVIVWVLCECACVCVSFTCHGKLSRFLTLARYLRARAFEALRHLLLYFILTQKFKIRCWLKLNFYLAMFKETATRTAKIFQLLKKWICKNFFCSDLNLNFVSVLHTKDS